VNPGKITGSKDVGVGVEGLDWWFSAACHTEQSLKEILKRREATLYKSNSYKDRKEAFQG